MSWLARIKNLFGGSAPRAVLDRSLKDNPLREFVYLDEVSLRSLLSSKTGEMTETTSKETTQSFENEFRSTAGASIANVGKAEASSRFQTHNSSTLQTAKKATVQSWFRELDKIKGIRLIETVQRVQPFTTASEIESCNHRSVAIDSAALTRGEIVEFKVRLSADPIFHLVTLVSEFKGMAQDYPSMISGNGGFDQLHEIEGISKILQRLLAGLIPVRAEVLDYVIVENSTKKYLVHIDALQGLDIEYKPLEIVCVTELDAYWKDIRRVLFSDAEFTMLCRIAKPDIQDTWTPIKLADLLKGLVPNLARQLDFATRFLFDPTKQTTQIDKCAALRAALANYAETFMTKVDWEATDAQKNKINSMISELELSDQSATIQKQAFSTLATYLSTLSNKNIDPEIDVDLRNNAREFVGLGYFGELDVAHACEVQSQDSDADQKLLLDVEVVAMYW